MKKHSWMVEGKKNPKWLDEKIISSLGLKK
jgi:hypothetical protein